MQAYWKRAEKNIGIIAIVKVSNFSLSTDNNGVLLTM